jgi:hypothetical protein
VDNPKRLAAHLEKLRRTLLALETYMAQVRDLIAVTQGLIGEPADPSPAPTPRRQPARRK